MSDTTPTGSEYNVRVFAVLKDWIHNILSTSSEPYTPDRMADRFVTLISVNCGSNHLRKSDQGDRVSDVVT